MDNSGESGPPDSLNGVIETVFRDHHESLLAFLNFKLKSVSEAHDIAQDAYARALHHGLPEDLRCARAYVFKIANNLAINRLIECRRKRESLAQNVQNSRMQDADPPPDNNIECGETLRTLVRAVDELPWKCRRAFVLHKFEFLEYQEVARRMNLTESMIRKYVLRGIRHCRRRLDEQTNDAVDLRG